MDALSPSTSNGAVNPWDRQEGETSKAYAAFQLYKDGGSERSFTRVAERLCVSKQALGKWTTRFHWVGRALAWDNHQSRTINDAVLSDLVKQARQLQRLAARTLERIDQGETESLSVPEVCMILKTVCCLADAGSSGTNGQEKNEYGFPADLPSPVFHIVTYSKPDSHFWVRREDDPLAVEGFHVPQEIAVAIKQQFPQYLVVI